MPKRKNDISAFACRKRILLIAYAAGAPSTTMAASVNTATAVLLTK